MVSSTEQLSSDMDKSAPDPTSIDVGYELPVLEMAPLTRQTLAIYCGASGDHNPIHVDIDFARASGLDDVIAHGMLVMAYTGRLLTHWVSQQLILEMNTRFQAMTHIGDRITATGTVTEKFERDGRVCVRISISAVDQHGETKTTGEAVVALGEHPI